ncbi:hypothetical protein FQN54_006694 [Arachnomyces sp. PD_36]|nr:hypothetical protein FQN54_006694 [Arachnomyces sp. PD_36]
MVRLKHRYLLLQILYPPSASPTLLKGAEKNAKEYTLELHRPTPDTLTPALLARAVKDVVGEMYGDWGVGKLGGSSAGGIGVKYLSPATSTAIIRCPRSSYRLVWSALTYMSSLPAIKGRGGAKPVESPPDCVFRVVRVSGTMRKAEEEAIRRARREVLRMRKGGEEGGMAVLDELFGNDEGMDVDVDRGIESEEEDDDDE